MGCHTLWDIPIPALEEWWWWCNSGPLPWLEQVCQGHSKQYETGKTRVPCGGRKAITQRCTALREKQQSRFPANCSLPGMTKNEGGEDRGVALICNLCSQHAE